MKIRLYIFKLIAFTLCALYLNGTVGMTIYSCVCSGSKQLSFLSIETEHACCKKDICCPTKQGCKNEHKHQSCSNSACTSESLSLKVEHQPEQAKLSFAQVDFVLLPVILDKSQEAGSAYTSCVSGLLSRNDSPPKIPLIYQHSCLRL